MIAIHNILTQPHPAPVFWVLLAISIIENIMLVVYCIKVKRYKKQLDDYKHHPKR
jgi:hypothetical protein